MDIATAWNAGFKAFCDPLRRNGLRSAGLFLDCGPAFCGYKSTPITTAQILMFAAELVEHDPCGVFSIISYPVVLP